MAPVVTKIVKVAASAAVVTATTAFTMMDLNIGPPNVYRDDNPIVLERFPITLSLNK